MIYAISNSLLYICFAIVAGMGVLSFIPSHKKPGLALPKQWIVRSILLIPLFAVVPVLYLTSYIHGYREDSKVSSFFYVITQIETGRAWLALLFLAVLFTVVVFSVLPCMRQALYLF